MILNAYDENGTKAYHFWLDNGGEQTQLNYRVNGFDEPPARTTLLKIRAKDCVRLETTNVRLTSSEFQKSV